MVLNLARAAVCLEDLFGGGVMREEARCTTRGGLSSDSSSSDKSWSESRSEKFPGVEWIFFAIPKSPILQMPMSSTRTFSSLMSRWT